MMIRCPNANVNGENTTILKTAISGKNHRLGLGFSLLKAERTVPARSGPGRAAQPFCKPEFKP